MKTIIYDRNALQWVRDKDCNMSFLRAQESYLEDLLIYQGYLYLNQIYEKLGVEWDPSWENALYLADDGPIAIKFEPVDAESGDILIHIN